MRKGAVILTVCLMLSWATSSYAQNSARRKASAHVKRGKQLEAQGKYNAAVAEFQRAYKLVPHPIMFYNIALNYRLARNWTQARVYYDKYLTVTPRGKLADLARQAMVEVRAGEAAMLAKRRSTEAERKRQAVETERKRQAVEAERKRQATETERKRQAAEAERKRQADADRKARPEQGTNDPNLVTTNTTPAVRAKGGGLKIAGLVTAGLGLVSVGLGVKFGLDAQSISDELSQDSTAPWTEDEIARQDDGKSAQTKQIMLTAVGAAFVVGGAAMYLLGKRAGTSSERLVLAPVVMPEQLGWALAGRF